MVRPSEITDGRTYLFNVKSGNGGVWEKTLQYFNFRRDEFLQHYQKRSNVESTFAMIQAKFRDHVRSKTDIAIKNEVLGKILCHNICCLISEIYELGINPAFGLAN
jgi:transposase